MPAVLGIDAAWTAGQPSGVALVRGRDSDWECVAVAPSYADFLALAQGKPVDWDRQPVGGRPEVDRLMESCRKMLSGERLEVVAVDMPLSLNPIRGRRAADDEISRNFGKYGCAVHSPNADRPGGIADGLRAGFAGQGYPLAVKGTRPGTSPALLEVYPHTALLKLLGRDKRVPYKISRSSRYWPNSQAQERRGKLLGQWREITAALQKVIQGIRFSPQGATLASLKRWEDAIDSLVCAWVGIEYLAGRTEAYGDGTSSIWTPV